MIALRDVVWRHMAGRAGTRISKSVTRAASANRTATKTGKSGSVGDDAVAPVALGAIERLVGALENARCVVVGGVERGNADRDRDLDRLGALRNPERLRRDPPAQ